MTWMMFLLALLVSVLGRIFAEDAKSLIPRRTLESDLRWGTGSKPTRAPLVSAS